MYIGRSPEYGNAVSQQITGTNSVGPYTLSYDTSTSGVVVSLDGVVQRNSVDFNIVGTALTFTSTVGTGIIINVVFTGLTLSFPTPSDNSVDSSAIVAGAVDDSHISGLAASKLTGALPAISGASLTALNATNLGSGTVPTARLGSGTASSSTFLRGDQTYAAAGGGIGEFTPTGGNSIAIAKTVTPLQSETGTSNNNIGMGEYALQDCTSSNHNIAIGTYSLAEVSNGAGYNTAVGVYACQNVSSGNNNTGMANSALYSCNTGSFNSGYGRSTLLSTTSGSNNSALGYNAQSSGATASNEITLGNSSVSSLRCQQTSISSLSDERDKAEITDLPEEAGLDLINALRPRTYYWDMRDWYEEGVTPDGSKIKRTQRSWKSNSGMRQGFIAQEVESAIAGVQCLEDSKVVSGTEDKKEVAPAHLLTNAIKAIQQLSAENKALLARIEILEKA